MAQRLTIVMYHYVRPLAASRYPRIKGLELELFRQQVDYLRRHYTPVAMEDVVARDELPPRSVLLTFDDGFSDHYAHAFPILAERGVPGVFFPPSSVVLERRVLDVHKVHFLLAVADARELVGEIERSIEQARDRFELSRATAYRAQHAHANRFDSAEVIYVKRMLQHVLPEALRREITGRLFRHFVTADEEAFAEELYVSLEQLREMADGGMHIGSHGHRHYWLNRLPRSEQARDIDRSLDLLDRLGMARQGFTFCYPYGAYDADTLELLAERGCAAAVTTHVDIAVLEPSRMLELARLDTNDLPKDRLSAANSWTRKAH